jgi:DNA-binding response OmpR family regulator
VARVVLVCSDECERTLLLACLTGHDIASVKSFKDAGKALTQAKPDLAVIRVNAKDSTGMDVLRLMKRSQILVPMIVVLPRQAGFLATEAWQLGVRSFLSAPIHYDDFRKAMDKVQHQAQQAGSDIPPPITEAEHAANLSLLVHDLHKKMKCPAGTNRVLIRSVVTGLNEKSEPRICLCCAIRQSVGLSDYAYFEHIRDYCCNKPKTCDAVVQYKKLRQAKG